ncbi:TPA: hypothetical protein ACF03E_004318 [Escherichia coli]
MAIIIYPRHGIWYIAWVGISNPIPVDGAVTVRAYPLYVKQEDFSDITATAKHQFRDKYAREEYQLQKILQLRPTSMHTMAGGYHETVLYTRQSGGDVLIIGVYAHRTRYDDVLCGYTNHMYLM